MNRINHKNKCIILFSATLFAFIFGCQKVRTSACDGKTIAFNITVDSTSTDTTNDGRITVVASGSTGFTYKLNYDGVYSETNIFSNLKFGKYDVYAKDDGGCEKVKHITVIARDSCTALPGIIFTQVRNLLDAKCISCHNNSTTSVTDYTINCNVLLHKDSIYHRVIIVGNMPPADTLSTQEKSIITDWLSAGGKISD